MFPDIWYAYADDDKNPRMDTIATTEAEAIELARDYRLYTSRGFIVTIKVELQEYRSVNDL
jgi:hypothetical protein